MIVAELVDGCPLKCKLCWNHDRRGSFKNMSLNTVEKVLKKYGDGPRIDWHNWGEPLLHKKFADVAERVKGTHSRVSSSLSLIISDQKLKAFHNFEHIVVSLSGMSKETYGIYHKGGDLDLVMKNLKRLAPGRKNYIRVQWLDHNLNRHELSACAEMCRRLDLDFCAKGLNCTVEKQQHGWNDGLIKKYRSNRKECYILDDVVIGADGQYLLCCASHNVEIGLRLDDNASYNDIVAAKQKTKLCAECRKDGLWRMY